MVFNVSINRIPCCSCNIRHNHAVLSRQFIDEGGLAHIWFSHNRNLRTLVRFFFLRFLRKIFYHLIKHIAESQHGRRRNRIRLPDSQVIKFINIRHVFFKAVHFVDNKNHRFPGTAQHVTDLGIRILQPLFHIRDKHNDIGGCNCNFSLLTHLGKNNIPTVRFDSPGINHGKTITVPVHLRINTVPGNARRILHN